MNANYSSKTCVVVCFSVFSLAFTLSSIVLTSFMILGYPITSFDEADLSYTHSLYGCIDCPDKYSSSSYSCLEKLECTDGDSKLCEIGRSLSSTRWMLLVAEIISLILAVMLLETHSMCLLTRTRSLKLLILITIHALIRSFVLLLILIKFHINTEISLEIGSVLACLNSILVLLSVIFVIFYYSMSNKDHPQFYLIGKTLRKSLIKTLIIIAIGCVLWCIALCLNFLKYEKGRWHHGNFFTIDMPQYGSMEFSCAHTLLSRNCDSKEADAMARANGAFVFYVVSSVPSVTGLVLWVEGILLTLAGKRPLCLTVKAWVCCLACWASVIGYTILSGVTFGPNCKTDSSSSSVTFCAENGLILVIASCVLLSIAALLCTVVLYLVNFEQRVIAINHDLISRTIVTENQSSSIHCVEKPIGDFNDSNLKMNVSSCEDVPKSCNSCNTR